MKDPEHKNISDPSYNAADFGVQLTGGRLRWLASVFAVASGGMFIYLLTQGEKATLEVPFHIEGRAAVWTVGIGFAVWVAIAIVNWKSWLGEKKGAS